ncbi:MAG TPA: hypothetical protein VH518_02760, partial [Tepidisphaeraceae bacterium]
MNWMHWLLLTLLAIFIVLLGLSRRSAWKFARVTTLTLVALIILMPFVWLVCSAFKDPNVMNESTFLPGPSTLLKEGSNVVN